jgi:ubiquinone/menaquinone biosynthesis C-methylase UbiE
VDGNPVPGVEIGRFGRVDESPAPDAFVRWMAHQRRHGPDRALEMLELTPQSRVLDVGCGPGADLERLSALAGGAVGIDRSWSMSRTAAGVPTGSPGTAHVVHGDGLSLPFADGAFDACWARAVLLHVDDPQAVVHEIVRVLRPGGRVVLSEPDQGSHVVSSACPETFERIKAHRQLGFRNPLVGRRLAALVSGAGMEVDRTWPCPILHRTLAEARDAGGPFDAAADAAVASGAVSQADAARYLASLEELDAAGGFLFAALSISVAAHLPGG